jgi:lipopolysaccharide transport system ATP-binding protein
MSRIFADRLVLDFPIYGSRHRSLKGAILRAATGAPFAQDANDHVVVRALDELSFECLAGDRIGLMGHNGSGKTTLLRAIAGGYEPTSGALTVEGRVASMLSITLGLNIEASGYDNIFLLGAIMGRPKRQVRKLVDEIVEFAGLDRYIDLPVRTYSSGMALRLAFAVATSAPADIIVMDEWLSVGDEQFAIKAQERLESLLAGAEILVLASHNEALIRKNCNRLLRLEHGRLKSIETLVSSVGGSAPMGAESAAPIVL